MTKYGPNNPQPLSLMKTEVVSEEKYDEFGQKRGVSQAKAVALGCDMKGGRSELNIRGSPPHYYLYRLVLQDYDEESFSPREPHVAVSNKVATLKTLKRAQQSEGVR